MKKPTIDQLIINSQILIYQTEGGQTKIEVRLESETVRLTQKLMAELFQTTKQNISFHIQNIYNESELSPEATVKEYLIVQKEGKRKVSRAVDFYNLDMIICRWLPHKIPCSHPFPPMGNSKIA